MRWPNYDVPISDWMFLNLTVHDFGSHFCERETPTPPAPTQCNNTDIAYLESNLAARLASLSPSLSWNPSCLNRQESHLLEYFINFITPRCALVDNPYRDILLRLALTGARGPLMDCIMAAAANQMQIVGHGESAESALHRRDRALTGLREQVSVYKPTIGGSPVGTDASKIHLAAVVTGNDLGASDQLIWSAVMMCFFEISLDCPLSWKVHAEFASKLLLHEAARQPQGRISESHQFAAAYLSLHHTLSCSASGSLPWDTTDQDNPHRKVVADSVSSGFMALQCLPNDSLFRTLTGCSKTLVALISEITDLAQHPDIYHLSASSRNPNKNHVLIPVSTSNVVESVEEGSALPTVGGIHNAVYLRRRRDSIERRLHQLAKFPSPSVNNTRTHSPGLLKGTSDLEMGRICEVKRLAALMYLYARIDLSDPYKPHMVRLTDEIIRLIGGISTRTNTVLWPLFIVATLGVRPDCEDDRLVVLTKLSDLQQTRQLGNVRKARGVIEDVWKARDLRLSDAFKGWDILHGRLDTISLA